MFLLARRDISRVPDLPAARTIAHLAFAEVPMDGWIRTNFTDETAHSKSRHQGFCHAGRVLGLAAALLLFFAGRAAAEEAQWIWSPDHAKENVPTGEACHFRKVMPLRAPESGQIAIAADDQYELYINGRRIGVGEATKKLD